METFHVLQRLKHACDEAGGQKAWADKHKMSEAYLSDTLNGRREPGPKILKILKLEKVISYREKKDA